MQATIINQKLCAVSSAVGYVLWRQTIEQKRQRYGRAISSAQGSANVFKATVLHEGYRCVNTLRTLTSGGRRLDRFTGTGWDGAAPPCGTPSMKRSTRDLDRLDLGRCHTFCANQLGGSDAAVLATHLPFFVLRMSRHAVVGTITGVGFGAGCLYGAGILLPLRAVGLAAPFPAAL